MTDFEKILDVETFTQDEKERLNLLLVQKKDEKELTYSDVELVARFKVAMAMVDERLQMEREALEAESAARIEAANELKRAALDKMKARSNLAKARLAKIEGSYGQIEK